MYISSLYILMMMMPSARPREEFWAGPEICKLGDRVQGCHDSLGIATTPGPEALETERRRANELSKVLVGQALRRGCASTSQGTPHNCNSLANS